MRLFTDQVHRAQKNIKRTSSPSREPLDSIASRPLLVDKTKRKDFILCAGEISMGIAPAAEMAVNWLEKLCLNLERLRYDSQTQAIGDQSEQRVHP
jgi:hypothetical protein